MMKKILVLSLALTAFIANAQTYEFRPDWIKGTVKNISISTTEREFENDSLILETTYSNAVKLTVLKETKSQYTLEVIAENQVLKNVMDKFEELGENYNYSKDMKLLYAVEKDTGERTLVNWKEVRDFNVENINELVSMFNKNVDDSEIDFGKIFDPIIELMDDKEMMEEDMMGYIEFIFIPYGQELELKKPIEVVETGESPFDASMEMSMTTITTLQAIDKKAGIYNIDQEVVFDTSQFVEMIKAMMKGMMESMIPKDSIPPEGMKDIMDLEIDMDMKLVESIEFNKNSGWVEKSVHVGTVSTSDPIKGKNTRKVVETTRTLD